MNSGYIVFIKHIRELLNMLHAEEFQCVRIYAVKGKCARAPVLKWRNKSVAMMRNINAMMERGEIRHKI